MKNNEKEVSRRKFLQVLGSVVAGGTLVGFTAALLKRTSASGGRPVPGGNTTPEPKLPSSPYRLVSAFGVPDNIGAFELCGDELVVAIPGGILVYDHAGELRNNFAVGSDVRDIAAHDGLLYLLFPSRIEVCDLAGVPVREWEAFGADSDHCSVAVAPEGVFVTDAGGKNICKYTHEGGFVKFIESPDRFIVPSYSFGITHVDGTLYCSNPGRHRVEKYSTDGEYLGSFGRPGGGEGMFAGCCNPVHLAASPAGEVITSEKGNPRISCYGPDGEFRSVLVEGGALGSGTLAAEVKMAGDKLLVAGRDRVSVFRYDPRTSSDTACGRCNVSCPLRTGVTV